MLLPSSLAICLLRASASPVSLHGVVFVDPPIFPVSFCDCPHCPSVHCPCTLRLMIESKLVSWIRPSVGVKKALDHFYYSLPVSP